MKNKQISNEGVKSGKAGLSKTQIILIVGMAAIITAIVIAGIVIYGVLNKESLPNNYQQEGNYVVDESNLTTIQNQIQESVSEGMFKISMNTIWIFDSSDKPSTSAYIANSESNHKPFFFEIILDETGEMIYTSTVLPVGTALKELVLEKALKAGEYPAACNYNLLNDDGTISSSLSIGVTILINN